MVDVDALAHLDGERDVAGGADGARDDVAEQLLLPRQRRSPALARDLGHGAAEVEVDVVGAVLRDEHPHRLGDGGGVDAVQLDRARRLGLVVRDEAHRRGVPLDESAGRDHLAHVQPRAVLAAQPPEGGVGDARHGSQDDGRVELDGPDAQSAGRSEGGRHPSILPDECLLLPERALAWRYDPGDRDLSARHPVPDRRRADADARRVRRQGAARRERRLEVRAHSPVRAARAAAEGLCRPRLHACWAFRATSSRVRSRARWTRSSTTAP